MADERYNWLDKEAAERLLRGESVSHVEDHRVRTEAGRLARALHDLTPVPRPVHDRQPGELPGELRGEEAALAAFRAARHASPTEPATVRLAASPDGTPDIGGHGQRRRPFQLGLAAALAAVAVGGVAVAAGTGALLHSAPDSAGPVPTGSVAASPLPQSSGSVARGNGRRSGGGFWSPKEDPSHSAGEGNRPGAADTEPEDAEDSTRLLRTEREAEKEPRDQDGTGTGTGKDASGRGDESGKESRRWMAETCRDYLGGRLDAEHRKKLDRLSGGQTRVDRFCAKVLGEEAKPSADSTRGGADSGGSGAAGDALEGTPAPGGAREGSSSSDTSGATRSGAGGKRSSSEQSSTRGSTGAPAALIPAPGSTAYQQPVFVPARAA
ncbi:hypothetical protein [Streptomyces sp. NPDC006879]|uniref:hypothetical protein n=1 Tax=Streptomyces sp. NPDC006879 TaxID=3364767 RepID=UPI0036B076B4